MMFKMETKKIMATFAVLMLALGIAGFAYAHWEKYMWLDVEVTTGKFDLEWSFNYTVSPENTKEDPVTGEEWNVSDIGYEFVDDDGDGNYEGLFIWIYNAYPCLWINGTIDIHNTGTIPAKLYDYDYGGVEQWMEDALWDYQFRGDCEQIDPCDALYLDFWIHFPESTPQGERGYLWFDLYFCNWNETP